jgi:L-cysteine:1D-myo-inositol 2-amino-2-deoxy-alpha-D-glucopyranoside ligase
VRASPPYDATHLGHASTNLAFDTLQRVWRDAGVAVTYTQNVTDVDDPLLERANATGVDWTELAERETELFRDDMQALRVLAPDHYIGAVESVPLVVEHVQRLLDAAPPIGVDGDVYFAVRRDRSFGSVSGLDDAAMRELFAERGGDPDRSGKRDPLDCLVWLAARPGEPSWESPLGPGRPGWHAECSAISTAYLGPGSTSRAAAATSCSRTTRCRRPRRASRRTARSRRRTSTPGWSDSTAPR